MVGDTFPTTEINQSGGAHTLVFSSGIDPGSWTDYRAESATRYERGGHLDSFSKNVVNLYEDIDSSGRIDCNTDVLGDVERERERYTERAVVVT